MTLPFTDKRFIVVAGKGGVGKSTVCAALGLAAARAGKRTIIAELNTTEKAPGFFGKVGTGYDISEIYDNLFSINIRPDEALHEYGLMKLRFERVYKLVFENEAMRRLLRMIPGMNELFMLGKAFNMERERTRSGEPVWDMVIVDAPATGHGVSLLRLPQVILEVTKSGPMAEEVGLMRDLLMDPARTMLNLVSLAEEMPVKETIMLHEQVDQILAMPTGYLFVNGLWPDVLAEAERPIVEALSAEVGGTDPRTERALACLGDMATRHGLQQGYVKTLAQAVPLPRVEMPFLFTREFGFDAIDTLSTHIVDRMMALAA